MKKDLFIRFLLGGTAVMASYLIIVISPWEILGGIFAAFPAVMITAVLMAGISSGTTNAAKIANGSVYGMIGGIFCAASVWMFLTLTHNLTISMGLGLIIWLFSSILVSSIKERISKEKMIKTDNTKSKAAFAKSHLRNAQ
ncbi:DUF3147 family protein [Neobacillus kokaensis]|uniref:DUF3147 family protein n=1 Tax=Neobacillus kokaensis TaxID=2759023 RepID=A0ABQ3N4H3_9BACI|nr:DUF3147 family protein [Neobacillus kokaensis]GHH99824.1 hypothetical protein AM1BK_33670 [Neobacillus kokaensis]